MRPHGVYSLGDQFAGGCGMCANPPGHIDAAGGRLHYQSPFFRKIWMKVANNLLTNSSLRVCEICNHMRIRSRVELLSCVSHAIWLCVDFHPEVTRVFHRELTHLEVMRRDKLECRLQGRGSECPLRSLTDAQQIKMLRVARTAGLVKLRHSIRATGERQQWAVYVGQTGEALRMHTAPPQVGFELKAHTRIRLNF